MKPTLIIECGRCGGLLLATAGQKTRNCPYCGTQINVIRAKRVASAKNAFEASEMLRKLKSRKSFSRE